MAGLEPEGGCRRPVLFVYVVIGAGQLNDEEGIGTAAEVDHCSISRSCAVLRVIYTLKYSLLSLLSTDKSPGP